MWVLRDAVCDIIPSLTPVTSNWFLVSILQDFWLKLWIHDSSVPCMPCSPLPLIYFIIWVIFNDTYCMNYITPFHAVCFFLQWGLLLLVCISSKPCSVDYSQLILYILTYMFNVGYFFSKYQMYPQLDAIQLCFVSYSFWVCQQSRR
jgi:hypothetical protein